MTSLLDKVDVHEAGDKIILSSHEEATLRYVVAEMRKDGARGLADPVKIGARWVTSFEHPGLARCTVERAGYQIVIAGPSEDLVIAKSHEFREKGALLTRGPELDGGQWKLHMEDTGARTGNMVML